MPEIVTRALAGTVFVALIIGSILFGHPAFSMLFGIVTLLGVLELYTLLNKIPLHPQKMMGALSGILLYSTFASKPYISSHLFHLLLIGVLLILFLVFVAELFRKKEQPFQNIGATLLGTFYVALPFSLLHLIAFDQEGKYTSSILIAVFVLTWTNDTFAYLSGKAMGKNKLFERISPGKTWEGSIGGVLLNLAAAYVIGMFFQELSTTQWMGMALLISVMGTLGDLAESLLKRSIGVKDSGNIMPGHGGILDRFDAMLLSLPFVVVYLTYI